MFPLLWEHRTNLWAQEKRRSSPYATQVCDNLLPIMGSLRFKHKPLIGKSCSFLLSRSQFEWQ